MHISALHYGQSFFETYFKDPPPCKRIIVDVGSQDVNGSLRQFAPQDSQYVGVDFVEGAGVDIVIKDPYKLPFETGSVDAVVCSSVYEHSEFFWMLFLESLRILKPTGLLYLNAPSNGALHRYPIDAWRFYPDAGKSLTKWARHNGIQAVLLESFIGEKFGDLHLDGMWNDFVAVIARDEENLPRTTARIIDSEVSVRSAYAHGLDLPASEFGLMPDQLLMQEYLNNTPLTQSEEIDLRQRIQLEHTENARLNETIQIKQAETDLLRSSLNLKQAELDQLSNVIQAMQSSRSWRYTSIARQLGSITQLKAGSKAWNLLNAASEFGGFTRLSKKAYFIIRTQGLSAFLGKAINYVSNRKGESSPRTFGINKSSTLARSGIFGDGIPVVEFDSTRDHFVDFIKNDTVTPEVRTIAFYLPQFHPFPENDAWWGKGFTEWSNVGKAQPNYAGHYQPHCPIHLGYYDLRVQEVMEEQAALAKNYGVYGFNYYFYWFGGKILMDKPLEQMLQNKKVDIPFCLTWANENWTRRWDGQESDVLIAQSHSEQDSLEFIRHLIKYFTDERYIRINGCPLLLIYRANIIPNMKETLDLWRAEVKKHGIKDLYAVCCQTFGLKDPGVYGFEAAAEFPPHTIKSTDITDQLNISNKDFRGHIYSYDQVVENSVKNAEPAFKLFRTAMLSWDNTARKQNQSHIFHGFSLVRYKQWLAALCNNVFHSNKYSSDEKIVFINAWNEWAEGTHLEPDRKLGYGYLQATYDVVSNFDCNRRVSASFSNAIRRASCAVVVHAHYEDVLSELLERLKNLRPFEFDLYVTADNIALLEMVSREFPLANLHLVENRGRDILPFIDFLRVIGEMGYSAVCKLHTKKSIYRNDGDLIRDNLFSGLIGDANHSASMVRLFENDPSIGMAAISSSLVQHTDHNMTYDHAVVKFVSDRCGVKFERSVFPAGSMFWFRPDALKALLSINKEDFPLEMGLADGTIAHGIERILASTVTAAGFRVITI